jgi:hypothetical protein
MPKPSFDELDSQVLRPENPIVAAIMAAWRKFFGKFSAANTARTTATSVLPVQVVGADGGVGITKDGGAGWTTSRGISGARFTSADQSGSVASITDAPTADQKLVITDLLISSDTALRLDFNIESSGAVIETVYMAANETKQITPRGKWKLATADKKLQVQSSVAGNISITPFYYSEA